MSDGTRIETLERRVRREIDARKSAERILERKSHELFTVNRALLEAKQTLEHQFHDLQIEKERVQKLADTDALTGISNRRVYKDELDALLVASENAGAKTTVLLALIDLRQFRLLNLELGHSAGDYILTEIAMRLERMTRHNGFAARIGGNEFALAMDVATSEKLLALEQIKDTLMAQISCNGRNITVAISIGAVYLQDIRHDPEVLQNAAEAALQAAKRDKTGIVRIFDHSLERELAARQTLEYDLRKAIANNAIEPWFQPICNPITGRLNALEVLARWKRDTEFISPDIFIPMAEEIGLRKSLDEQLIHYALLAARPWIEAEHVGQISLNFSPTDLARPNLIAEVDCLLKATGFPSRALIVEVTESIFIEDIDFISEQLVRLKELGVQIALDDFGTGYSNLRSLVQLPISKIKLDRSLIKDLNQNTDIALLVSSLLQWCRAINLDVVAEGVETEAQEIVLKSLGCTQMQGFYYSAAVPGSDIQKSMDNSIPLIANF